MGLYFPREEKGGEKTEGEGKRRRGEYQRRVWTQTALLTSSPKEGKSKREKETGKRQSKSKNLSNRKPKNFPSVTSTLLFPSSFCSSSFSFALRLPIRPLHLSMCKLTLQLNNMLLPSPSPFLAPFSPSAITLHTFHYLGDQAKRDVWVGAIIIITSFCYTVSYSPLYRKQTFKS